MNPAAKIPIGFMVVQLGQISVSRKAAAELDEYQAGHALLRHMIGDWGDIDREVWQSNDVALDSGERIVSYHLDRQFRPFLIVTEANRKATTILLPGELE